MTEPLKRHSIVLPAAVLRRCGADAELLLLLGAFANALQTQMHLGTEVPEGQPGAQRDRFQTLIVAIGYLKEAVDTIQQHQARLRELMNTARNAGYPLKVKWSQMKPLLTQEPGSLYERAVEVIRHDLSFHIDPAVFANWLAARKDDERICVWEIVGTTNRGVFYRASADALVGSMAKDPPELKQLLTDLATAQRMLVALIESATTGAMLAAGIRLNDYFTVESLR